MTLAAPPSPSRPRPTPLFVLGAPRSGTTFLQQVIDAHPEVFVTDELRAASWLVQEAGKLREGRTVHGNPYPLTQGRAFAEYLLDNAGRILLPFYLQQARRAGKPAIRYWGDKYPHYDEILHLLPRLFPEARYVLIHRDLRDTISSVMQPVRLAGGARRPLRLPHLRPLRAQGRRIDPRGRGPRRALPARQLRRPEHRRGGRGGTPLRRPRAWAIRRPPPPGSGNWPASRRTASAGRTGPRSPSRSTASHQRWDRDLSPADLAVALREIAGIAEAVAIGNRQQPGKPFSYPTP